MRSIIARLDIGREEIEKIIASAFVDMQQEIGGALDEQDVQDAAEYATNDILDLFVHADERLNA